MMVEEKKKKIEREEQSRVKTLQRQVLVEG
jgi:hypothetical protein